MYSPELDGDARGFSGPQRGEYVIPAEPRFFRATDHFQLDVRLLLDVPDKSIAVTRFARGARGYGAILCNAELIHDSAKMTKRLDAFLEGFFAETVPHKNAFPQAQRVAFRVQWLDMHGGISPRHREAHSGGAGLAGGNINRLRHFGICPHKATD